MIPRFLFRGDADCEGKRQLRSANPNSFNGFLLTNLSNQGSGREIFTAPLVEAVNRMFTQAGRKLTFSRSPHLVNEQLLSQLALKSITFFQLMLSTGNPPSSLSTPLDSPPILNLKPDSTTAHTQVVSRFYPLTDGRIVLSLDSLLIFLNTVVRSIYY